MIKNLVFDMGQVLMRFAPSVYVDRLGYSGADKEALLREVFAGVEWVALDRGRMDFGEAVKAIEPRLPERLRPAVRPLVIDWWKGDFMPIEGMEELIGEVKALGYGIYLLSNATSALNGYFCRIPGSEFFDGLLISADEGLAKPQHEIYERFCEKFSLRPEECFFIDDQPANIDGAACVGMPGAVFFGDMARLRRELRQAGIAVSGG